MYRWVFSSIPGLYSPLPVPLSSPVPRTNNVSRKMSPEGAWAPPIEKHWFNARKKQQAIAELVYNGWDKKECSDLTCIGESQVFPQLQIASNCLMGLIFYWAIALKPCPHCLATCITTFPSVFFQIAEFVILVNFSLPSRGEGLHKVVEWAFGARG